MNFLTFSAYKPDGTLFHLYDILSIIKHRGNELVWSILEYDGFGGIAPNGMGLPEFEQLILSLNNGYFLSFNELQSFAESIIRTTNMLVQPQTLNCLIVGAISTLEISNAIYNKEIDKHIFNNCELVIEMFDSSEWTIGISDNIMIEKVKQVLGVEVTDY